MHLPRLIHVEEFEKKYYAFDNEILWIAKEIQKMKHILEVSVEVKIEMDPPLFRGFISGNIQKDSIKQTTFSHSNEELFIFSA